MTSTSEDCAQDRLRGAARDTAWSGTAQEVFHPHCAKRRKGGHPSGMNGFMVMVCHPHQLVFLETCKSASTSVERFVKANCLTRGSATGAKARPSAMSGFGIVGRRGGPAQRGALALCRSARNRTAARVPHGNVYNGDVRTFVARRFGQELSQFGYAFGQPDPHFPSPAAAKEAAQGAVKPAARRARRGKPQMQADTMARTVSQAPIITMKGLATIAYAPARR